jgi:hypothetical protein
VPGVEPRPAADSGPSLTSRSLPGDGDLRDGGDLAETGGIVGEWSRWLTDQWRWDWFFTGTFGDPDEPARRLGHTSVGWTLSDRLYREWVAELEARSPLQSVYWFRAREPHKHRSSTHFHALIGGVGKLSRRDAWRLWFERNGRARIEPITTVGAVATYVSKYVLKAEGQYEFSPNVGLFKRTEAARDGNADIPFGWRGAGW